MGLKDLEGKRTGRPRGSKSTRAWVRDVRWACQNLGNPDAKPPTALAGLLVVLGREHPDRFVACLALADAQGPNNAQCGGAGGPADRFPGDGSSRRLKSVAVREEWLLKFVTTARHGYVYKLPYDAHIASCAVDTSQRMIHIRIASEDYPEVTAEEQIPGLDGEYTSN